MGTDAPARKKTGALRFTKLRTIPGKMYFDVEGVRTKDNALITVKLMVFYQLKDVVKMLENTNDPMADFINSMSADIIEWCAPKTFDEFLSETEALNTLAPYSQITTSAPKIGYHIDRVVSRGYLAPNSLQKMHDSAIEKRTSLKLAKESEEEEQKLQDFRLGKQAQRAEQQQKLEMEKLNHELLMKKNRAENERQ